MYFFINDLSFRGVFSSLAEFKNYTSRLMRVRDSNASVQKRLHISNTITQINIMRGITFYQAIQKDNDKDYKHKMLIWITKNGPFWEDDRQEIEDDYFEYGGEDVTDYGLGEAARRLYAGIESLTFSVQENRQFNITPLTVQHGLPEDLIGEIDVTNLWDMDELVNIADSFTELPNDWTTFFCQLDEMFPNLIFSGNLINHIMGKPFYLTVRQRAHELLSVLNTIVSESDDNGELTARGIELINNHFVGKKAWFSAESASNQRNYSRALTFNDPDDERAELFCHWHGKIKTPQFRIHFEWPRPKGQKKIKVVYIGPKITVH